MAFDRYLNIQMYKEKEIAKARLTLLNNTNMVEYAMDEYKRVHNTEDVPNGKKGWKRVRIRHEESTRISDEAV